MNDKLELLEEKVGQLVERMEKLYTENEELRSENERLGSTLKETEKQLHAKQVEAADREEQVKSRLVSMLGRIDQLEKVAG